MLRAALRGGACGRRSGWAAVTAAAAAAAAAAVSAGSSLPRAEDQHQQHPPNTPPLGGICVFLDDPSLQALAATLEARHHNTTPPPQQWYQRLRRVTIQPAATPDDAATYAPLMGAAATVAVTGEARCGGGSGGGGGCGGSGGAHALTASVSVAGGPVPSLTLPTPFVAVPTGSDDAGGERTEAEEAAAAALLAGLERSGAAVADPAQRAFTGVVMVDGGGDDSAPRAARWASLAPLRPPLTLTGTICVDAAWDGSACVGFGTEAAAAAAQAAAEAGSDGDGAEGGGADDEWECPLCTLMRRSPCAAVFEGWRRCVTEAAPPGAGTSAVDDDAASEALAAACAEFIGPLKQCIDDNKAAFAELFGSDGTGAEEGGDGDGGDDAGDGEEP